MKCPICDEEITVYDTETLGDETIGENYMCKDDYHFYGNNYYAGNHEETINNVTVYWSYLLTNQEKSEVRFQRKVIIDLAKKYYRRKKEWKSLD